MTDPVLVLERDLNRTHLELAQLHRTLRRLGDTEAVSASHAVRRAELAFRTRREITRLEGLRDEQQAALADALRTVLA